MKIIIVTEERLDELVELALARIAKSAKDINADDKDGASYRTINYYVQEMKTAIKDSDIS